MGVKHRPLPPCAHRVEDLLLIWCAKDDEHIVERNELECRRCRAPRGRIVTADQWRELPDAERARIIERMRCG